MLRNPVRPVVIASICGMAAPDTMFDLVRQAAQAGPDLILLPENWQNLPEEPEDSAVIGELSAIAREHRVYILHASQLRLNTGQKVNSALLLDRQGDVASRYDKAYPYWSEFTDNPDTNTLPGDTPSVFATDFGMLGIAICFDVNFPHLWEAMDIAGAELVVWPSAYAAGTQLAAHALNHHYPIVSCTAEGSFHVFDLDGRTIRHTQNPHAHTEWITLDLDRCIFHENFNEDKLRALLDQPDCPVEVENHHREEQWYVLRSRNGPSARETCARAGMEELRAYKHRSRIAIDAMRVARPGHTDG
ncbi:MAG: carbon-nitrogen hydrolase family protein [Clostridiales bacterium]|nr:carbon-nitrogen hydrolase family protein [Clostridiales bacterium]